MQRIRIKLRTCLLQHICLKEIILRLIQKAYICCSWTSYHMGVNRVQQYLTKNGYA